MMSSNERHFSFFTLLKSTLAAGATYTERRDSEKAHKSSVVKSTSTWYLISNVLYQQCTFLRLDLSLVQLTLLATVSEGHLNSLHIGLHLVSFLEHFIHCWIVSFIRFKNMKFELLKELIIESSSFCIPMKNHESNRKPKGFSMHRTYVLDTHSSPLGCMTILEKS